MTSPFGPIALIADAGEERGRVRAELPAVQRALTARGLEHRVTLAQGPEDTMRATASALEEGLRFVVAVGGDGTVHDVVNGMFRDGATIVPEPVLGVIPGAAGNDLVRSFGLAQEAEGVVQRLAGETTYPMDVMKITCRGGGGTTGTYAANVVQVGMAARGAAARARLPRWLGTRGRSFVGFWAGYAGARRANVRIAHDAKAWEGEAFQVIVGNAQFTDGGLRISPRSWPGDGVLDALAFTGHRSDAYTMLPRILRHGDHLPHPRVQELRAKIRFEVEADPPLPVVTDGRSLGTTPVTVQVVPRSILFKL